MPEQSKYKKTLLACYLGFVTQAIVANFTPLLFVFFQDSFHLSLEQIASIPLTFFLTQLITDAIAAKYADRIGYRKCVLASQLLSALGLVLLGILPDLLPSPHLGILISVVLYAIGAGLIEVLISPIIEACPFENKEGAMSLLHSFYCWGTLAVIILSTVFFLLFGVGHWRYLAWFWALIPFLNAFNFITCPIHELVEEGHKLGIRGLIRMPLFWLLALLMFTAGASEISMSQWASAYAESALGVSKAIGDLAGPGLFAILMGIMRVYYGENSERMNLAKTMLICGISCVVCYLLAALSPNPVWGLIGCAFCGITCGLMWPGTLSISAQKLPRGGTALFALLALAGDFGGAIGPAFVGTVSSKLGGNLHRGILLAIIFPITLILALLRLRKVKIPLNEEGE